MGLESAEKRRHSERNAFINGSISSGCSTVLFQPLELLKTRLQQHSRNHQTIEAGDKILGRSTRLMTRLAMQNNVRYMWRGTGASLLRSVPGVGVYYSLLEWMHSQHMQTGGIETFVMGVSARSISSIILLPVTVTKTRYESGLYNYSSLTSAIKDSYLKSGWVGAAPTVIRDSLFSGIYYTVYTKLKSTMKTTHPNGVDQSLVHFTCGIIAGIIASVLTNPIDVLKTHMQINPSRCPSVKSALIHVFKSNGFIGLSYGLAPRVFRRSLVASMTWTIYERLKLA